MVIFQFATLNNQTVRIYLGWYGSYIVDEYYVVYIVEYSFILLYGSYTIQKYGYPKWIVGEVSGNYQLEQYS